MHGDDFVSLSDDDGLKHIDNLLKSKYTAKDMGTLGFDDSDAKSLLLLNRVFRVGTDPSGQCLDIEPQAPLIISDSGCNANTKTVSTARVAETAKHMAQRMSEPRECDFVQLKRAARYLVGKPKAALRFRRQENADKITVFLDRFAGDPVSRKSTTGLVPQIGKHTVTSGSTLHSLTALSVGEAEFYAVVNGGEVGPALRSINHDLGIPMKVETQNDSSTANSLTDRLGAGQRNTMIRDIFGYKNEFKTEISVSRRCPQLKYVQMLERSQSLLQYYNNIASLQDWYFTDHGSHTPLQDDGTSAESSRRWMCNTETDNCQHRSWTSRRVQS